MGELTVGELTAGGICWLVGVRVYRNEENTSVDRRGELTAAGVGWLAGVLVYTNKETLCVDCPVELTVGGS